MHWPARALQDEVTQWKGDDTICDSLALTRVDRQRQRNYLYRIGKVWFREDMQWKSGEEQSAALE